MPAGALTVEQSACHSTGMTSAGTDYTLDAIRAVLAEQELSQRGLARRLGWGRMRVQHLLNGNSRLTVSDLQAIAAALGVPVTALLPTAEPTR